MANEIELVASARESISSELGTIGDAADRMARQARVAGTTTEASFDDAARSTGRLGEALDTAQGGLGQLGDAFAGVGDAATAMQDVMSHSERKAEELARAEIDVEQAAQDASQAIEDMNQANRDAAQAGIDAKQAHIDQAQSLIDEAKAQKDYNDAVKEFGKNSIEAKQALNDIKQAKLDGKQASEDLLQAERDGKQATLDATQAATDYKSAQLDSAAANRELEKSGSALTKVAEWSSMLGGVMGGLAGVLGVVTVAQWAMNTAFLASPITWIVLGIVALVAVVVLIATKTKWFQTIWRVVWSNVRSFFVGTFNAMKSNAGKSLDAIANFFKAIPRRAKSAFSSLVNVITWPFRTAFNNIARLWNNTVGQISFSVPAWVPGIGGNSFSAPRIPSYAVGGEILRTGLAVVHRGETVTPTARAQRLNAMSGSMHAEARETRVVLEFVGNGNPWAAPIVELLKNNLQVRTVIDDGIRRTVSGKGSGSVQVAYGRRGTS